MPEVTPEETRAAVARSAQEPTEANQGQLNAVSERRRNPCPLGQGGCQSNDVIPDVVWLSMEKYTALIDDAGHVRGHQTL